MSCRDQWISHSSLSLGRKDSLAVMVSEETFIPSVEGRAEEAVQCMGSELFSKRPEMYWPKLLYGNMVKTWE